MLHYPHFSLNLDSEISKRHHAFHMNFDCKYSQYSIYHISHDFMIYIMFLNFNIKKYDDPW